MKDVLEQQIDYEEVESEEVEDIEDEGDLDDTDDAKDTEQSEDKIKRYRRTKKEIELERATKAKSKMTKDKSVKTKSKTVKPVVVIDEQESKVLSKYQSETGNLPDERNLEIYKDLSKYRVSPKERIRTNILSLDLVLGHCMRGEVIEICSPSGVGKSTLMMQLCKNIVSGKIEPHNPYGKVAYIDVEGGVNKSLIEKIGLDKYEGKQFQLLSDIYTFEALEEVLLLLIESEERFDAIIIDSITDVIPSEMFGKNINELQIGLNARYMTALINKIKPLVRKSGTTLWLVNQMRVKSKKVGFKFVMEEDAAGPNIVGYAPDVRLRLSRGDAIKHKTDTINGAVEVQIGTMSEIWSIKNRLETPFIRVSMPIIYGRGISDPLTMKQSLYKKDFLRIGGSTHYLELPDEESLKFSTASKFMDYLKEHVYEIRDKLEKLGHWKIINLGEVSAMTE